MTKSECLTLAVRYGKLARDFNSIADKMTQLDTYTAQNVVDARALARHCHNQSEKYRAGAQSRFRRWFL